MSPCYYLGAIKSVINIYNDLVNMKNLFDKLYKLLFLDSLHAWPHRADGPNNLHSYAHIRLRTVLKLVTSAFKTKTAVKF
jgi:hypothetical protein